MGSFTLLASLQSAGSGYVQAAGGKNKLNKDGSWLCTVHTTLPTCQAGVLTGAIVAWLSGEATNRLLIGSEVHVQEKVLRQGSMTREVKAQGMSLLLTVPSTWTKETSFGNGCQLIQRIVAGQGAGSEGLSGS